MPDWVRTVLVTVAVVALCGVVAVGLLMWRYRIPPRGLIAIGAAAIYLVSPVDVVPEVFLGPVGLLDDAGVVVAVGMFVYRLATVRRILTDGGVLKRRSGDGQRLRDDAVGDP